MASSESALFRSLLFPALLLLITCSASAQVVYVDQNAPGPDHDGTSWDTAFLTIQEGVDAATPGGDVWVADGTYVENVVMAEGVAIYGGFLGAEPGGYEDSLDQRDPWENGTIIDGGNAGSCVVMAVDATVDGFIALYGSGTLVETGTFGGGIYCYDLGASGVIANCGISLNTADHGGGICCVNSSPTIADCRLSWNSADYNGGGLYCERSSSPLVTRCAFAWNVAGVGGGGAFWRGSSSPTLIGCEISCNSAEEQGGGICSRGSGLAVIAGCMIAQNSADDYGGGLYCGGDAVTVLNNLITLNSTVSYGGGIYCPSDSTICGNTICGNSAAYMGGGICCTGHCSPTISGNAICGNSSSRYGGGICCWAFSRPVISNNVIAGNWAYWRGGGISYQGWSSTITSNDIVGNWAYDCGAGVFCSVGPGMVIANNNVTGNEARNCGGGIYCPPEAPPTLSSNNVWGNSPEDYHGCQPGETDISADPMFVDPPAGDFHLKADSPCIDAGDNSAPALPETDWEGEDRIVDGTVDIGADEFLRWTATAPDPQPECDGALFGEPQAGYPGWVWFSIPLTPADAADPNHLLGFACNGRLHRYDKYTKAPIVYQPPFSEWDLSVGDSYLLWLESEVSNSSYEGLSPFVPWDFEFKLGRQGWTWIGMPGLAALGGDEFMDTVAVHYVSQRTAREDYESAPYNWISWGWVYWDTWRQAVETFTPYAPFGHRTCYPWVGYRVWINVGTAMSEDDPDQVTLIWPKP